MINMSLNEFKRRIREVRAWHKSLPASAGVTLGFIAEEVYRRWPDTPEEDAMVMATMSCAPDDVIETISFDDDGVTFDAEVAK